MIRSIASIFKFAFVTLAFVAMASLGFAHRSTDHSNTPEIVAYLQSGGTLADICGIAGDHEPATHETCEACRLSDQSGLVDPAPLSLKFDQRPHRVLGLPTKTVSTSFDPVGFSVRAPPSMCL